MKIPDTNEKSFQEPETKKRDNIIACTGMDRTGTRGGGRTGVYPGPDRADRTYDTI
jgi:hypothetical protein